MIIAQVVDLAKIIFTMAANGCRGDGQQSIGGLAHRRYYNYGPTIPPFPHDGRDPLDGGGGFDRRATEFHHDHQSSSPSECISSALSTAAPAAPRIVLWVSATNL